MCPPSTIHSQHKHNRGHKEPENQAEGPGRRLVPPSHEAGDSTEPVVRDCEAHTPPDKGPVPPKRLSGSSTGGRIGRFLGLEVQIRRGK